MGKRYYKNTQYRNIRIFHTKEVNEIELPKGYILAFQSNLTDKWYYWRIDKDKLGEMTYLDNATIFSSRVALLRSFRCVFKPNDDIVYQGLERA
jgi:hypothetical protein